MLLAYERHTEIEIIKNVILKISIISKIFFPNFKQFFCILWYMGTLIDYTCVNV